MNNVSFLPLHYIVLLVDKGVLVNPIGNLTMPEMYHISDFCYVKKNYGCI